ncbi:MULTISPECIES: histone-like nucleoid-structuring protein Lsr2 [Streptomyces]|uniref:Lsr2 dimerization domain-containing protein n=1 Tax=Streptomyces TaxID=1883 RepID=UPI00099DCAED|nr:histone-like nucleoid-structuring protein Lsr2 [Streptomyces virginiae]
MIVAVKLIPVGESGKDEPGVHEAVTEIAGQRIVTYARLEKVDDLDGESIENVETYRFSAFDDEGEQTFHEIDLSPEGLERFREALKPYVHVSREALPNASSTQKTLTSAGKGEWLKRCRAWLKEAGEEVGEKGRIPNSLQEKYVSAHPDDPKPE